MQTKRFNVTILFLSVTLAVLLSPAIFVDLALAETTNGAGQENLLPAGTLTLDTQDDGDACPKAAVESAFQQTADPIQDAADSAEKRNDSNAISSIDSNITDSVIASADDMMTVSDEGLNPYQEGTILVCFKPDMTRSQVEDLAAGIGGVEVYKTEDADIEHGVARLRITDKSSVIQAVNRALSLDGVQSAQPNFVYRVTDQDDEDEDEDEDVQYSSVDDTLINFQWGLYEGGVIGAWDRVKCNGSLAVAVIDTGADLDHPDLKDNIVATYNALSSTFSVEDQVGHGTHVAGIISGVANNAMGVAGTSFNAKLVIIKATTYRGTDYDTMALVRAYQWLQSPDSSGKTVAEHYNVRIVNMSLGGIDTDRTANMPDDLLHKTMLEARDKYGILTVVAAGNGPSKELPYFTYPSDSYACLSVMNLEQLYDDEGNDIGVDLNMNSNYNVAGSTYKDICAPGTFIYSTWLNGGINTDTGTSMAAPFVAGVAALVFAANPYLTPTQVQSIIEVSATDLGEPGWDERYGYGMVNAAAAVRMANVARMEGCKVVGVYGTTKLIGKLGPGQGSAAGAWKWDVYDDTGSARFTRAGVLLGDTEGDVIVRGTCTTSTGAEISVIDKIAVLNPEVLGDDVVRTGSSASYTCDDPRWTWVWKVENGTGEASIDWTGKLAATKAGTVEVTATCSSNTDIVVRKQVTIAAAAAAAPMRAASCAPMLALLPAGTFTLDDTIAA